MNEFEIEGVIERPVEAVFAFVEKAENIPLYNPAVLQARQTSDGPLGIGATAVMTGRFLGKEFDTTWEMVDYKANEGFASRTTSGPFQMEVAWQFEATDSGGTRFVWHCKGDSRGFFKLAEPIMTRITKKQFEASADTLKAVLEADADR